jgi:hypothetical protein
MTRAVADALCGLPRIAPSERFPDYVCYKCPLCRYWHQAWDCRPLRRMLAQFPDVLIREG